MHPLEPPPEFPPAVADWGSLSNDTDSPGGAGYQEAQAPAGGERARANSGPRDRFPFCLEGPQGSAAGAQANARASHRARRCIPDSPCSRAPTPESLRPRAGQLEQELPQQAEVEGPVAPPPSAQATVRPRHRAPARAGRAPGAPAPIPGGSHAAGGPPFSRRIFASPASLPRRAAWRAQCKSPAKRRRPSEVADRLPCLDLVARSAPKSARSTGVCKVSLLGVVHISKDSISTLLSATKIAHLVVGVSRHARCLVALASPSEAAPQTDEACWRGCGAASRQ